MLMDDFGEENPIPEDRLSPAGPIKTLAGVYFARLWSKYLAGWYEPLYLVRVYQDLDL